MSEILIRKELRELRRKLESVKAERDALEKSVEMLAKSLGYAIWGEQEALQRVNALAVENAALKYAITTYSQSTHFCELCGKDDPCSTDDVCYALKETPATDAALAAIQAQGVEKFADMCREKSKLATTADSCAGWSNCSVHASSFAIRLREAK